MSKKREELVMKFSGDCLKQLEELKNHFNLKNKQSVVKLGISLLQRLYENKNI